MTKGKLYLIPTTLGGDISYSLPPYIETVINSVDHYIVEDLKSARRFLKKVGIKKEINELHFELLNEHTETVNTTKLLKPALEGKSVALLSEAGCPVIADPGSDLIGSAHTNNVKVVPLVGPSSIMLALMASGFIGQRFEFHGYLPRERKQREQKLRELETRSSKALSTQIFIEAPYRNDHMFESILSVCNQNTKLSIACDLTTDQELVITKSISEWKKLKQSFHKRPAVFLLSSI